MKHLMADLRLAVAFGLLGLLGTAPVSAPAAVPDEVPIVLLLDEAAYKLSGGGLMGSLISSSANKVGDGQTAEFLKRTPGVDWKTLATQEFACFAIPEPHDGACRKVVVLDNQAAIVPIAKEKGWQRMVVVELLQMFRPETRYRARAVFHDLVWNGKRFDDKRVLNAVYESYSPTASSGPAKAAEPASRDFWVDGTPSRLESDARNSLQELRRLGEFLEAQVLDRFNAPKGWKDLPKIKTLEQSGRAKCRGVQCSSVRVLEEKGVRTWLVYEKQLGPYLDAPSDEAPLSMSYGAIVASLDPNALMSNTNLFVLVAVPH